MLSQPAPPRVPLASSPVQAAPDLWRATWHGAFNSLRRAFSFKAKGAASGQDATPLRSAAGQSAVQPRNNSFRNNSDCFRSRSSRRGQGAAVALGTLKPSPFQPPPFIQINHAHSTVSVVPSFVAEQRTSGGLFSCARKSFAAGQK